MKIVLFYHSLVSDWNHGNAHFLRGIARELMARGHDVRIYEPRNAWSRQNLDAEQGTGPVEEFTSGTTRRSSGGSGSAAPAPTPSGCCSTTPTTGR
jgi:spore maturation protein CgeB